MKPLLLIALLMLAPAAFAAEYQSGHGAHKAGTSSEHPVIQAYLKAMMDMHTGMAIDYTGNADVDFVRGMIPHHQGAVDMAKIVLQHGKDPEIRKLAEDVIKAQESESAFMRAWLAKHEPR